VTERLVSVCERSVDSMVQIGDHVRLHRDGISLFTVVAIEEGRGVVEALDDAPGKYPFSCSLASLVPVDNSAR
jgi:hypothetical protein